MIEFLFVYYALYIRRIFEVSGESWCSAAPAAKLKHIEGQSILCVLSLYLIVPHSTQIINVIFMKDKRE